MTDWKDAGGELFLGSGQRLFLVDEDEQPVLEVRSIEFDLETATGAERQ
jgi:protein involved in temperature-dependent protein secretion